MIRRIPVSHIRANLLFGQKFTASFTKSQLQSSSYAPSIWLVFDEFLLRESHSGFLDVPLRALPKTNLPSLDAMKIEDKFFVGAFASEFSNFGYDVVSVCELVTDVLWKIV
jgi:hypothetical protein